MAGSIAHVLNMNIMDAMRLSGGKMRILYNEANRQRALDTITLSHAFGGGDKVQDHIDEVLKVHGEYTEGFYDDEFGKLKSFVMSGNKNV